MLFDLRSGRRRNLVKVVYATLAVLMGLSLFLVIGGFNIAELFEDNGTGDAAKPYEEQAERIEVRLQKDPGNPDLLLSLTRAQVNAGNAQVTAGPNGEPQVTTDAAQEFQKAYQSWSEYLKATDEPNPSLALVVAPMLSQLAELSTTYAQADTRIASSVEAQKIVAEQRPSVNSWTTLAFYVAFTDDKAASEEARAEALKLAGSKAEKEQIEKLLDEYEKNAQTYLNNKAKAEKEEQAANAGGGGSAGAPPSVENPLGGLGGSGFGE
ncbi:MAG TPA: hypothetical protein VI039_07400 [Solirubrobacterales bacterium]